MAYVRPPCHPDDLVQRHREASADFRTAAGRLASLAEEIAIAAVRDRFPTAERLDVLGEMNEDLAWTLRVQRVLDPAGAVLFDVALDADVDTLDLMDDVGVEYLDVLLDLTGHAVLGRHELGLSNDGASIGGNSS